VIDNVMYMQTLNQYSKPFDRESKGSESINALPSAVQSKLQNLKFQTGASMLKSFAKKSKP